MREGEEQGAAGDLPPKPIQVHSSFQPSSVWLPHPTGDWGHHSLVGNGCLEGDRKLGSSLNPTYLLVFVWRPSELPLHIPARLYG